MPARIERLNIYYSNSKKEAQNLPFPLWWNRKVFFEKYGTRKIDVFHPFYVNYAILLTSEEAWAWDKECRVSFYINPESKRSSILDEMKTFQSMLTGVKWIVVESNEWESGL